LATECLPQACDRFFVTKRAPQRGQLHIRGILPRVRFFAAAGLLLLADCRCKPPPDPSPQITTNLVVEDAGVVDAGIQVDARAAHSCPEPKKIVVVGEVPTILRWVYGGLLTDDTSEYDLATLAKKPLVAPKASEEDAGVQLPPGAHLLYVDRDRWAVFSQKHSSSVYAMDRSTGTAVPGMFDYVHGGRGLRFASGNATVVDLESGKEVFRHGGCTSDIGVSEPYALSETGAFLECWRDRNVRTLIGIDDPLHRSVELSALFDFLSPDETYVVDPPILASSRRTLEYHRVLEPPRSISSDVDPPDFAVHTKASFCGHGEIFAAYAAHPGERPSRVLVFRGSDGTLLASAPSAGSVDRARYAYLDFNASGTHMILLQSTAGGAATSVLFRLEE
jgi:hypothetical protein